MGVPHLIATLEPYAEHEALQDEDVVIDGPPLAYHILHICRANGIQQPSYRLLGRAVIKWLDELQNHRVSIQRIYFDGHLPSSKLSVRMERMVKSSSRLDDFFSAHPKGLGAYPISQGATTSVDFDVFQFAATLSKSKPFPDPSFLVPAVIDAIRNSSVYRPLLSIVPGEADVYCAKHVAQHGGLVMTSDSDLLVHDLGQGKVVFLRGIHRTSANNGLSCLMLYPRDIYRKIGLPASTEPCRFAYERRCSPNATVKHLVKACALPVPDAVDYEEFRQQYIQFECATLPFLRDNVALSVNEFDPRLSELLLQIGQSGCSSDAGDVNAKIFLPTMMESPLEGTAWEPSTPIRQLAYTIADWMMPGSASLNIYEYRRVRQRCQRGRQVSLMSHDLIMDSTNKIHTLLSQVRKTLRGSMSSSRDYWVYLCLALSMMDCEEQGKQSHVQKVLRRGHKLSLKSSGELSWDLVHFVAHVQAGLYSLRMLAQVLSLMTEACARTLATNLSHIRHLLLSDFPTLLEFPDTSDVLNFLEMSKQNHVLESLERLANVNSGTQSETQRTREPKEQGRKGHPSPGGLPSILGKHTKNNMFGLLDVDYNT